MASGRKAKPWCKTLSVFGEKKYLELELTARNVKVMGKFRKAVHQVSR